MATRPRSTDTGSRTSEVRPAAAWAALHDWADFATPENEGRWDALTAWATEPNPFFESWYLLPALREFDPGGRVGLFCLEADGQLAGLIPLRRDWTYYDYPFPQWSTWLHANCFLGAPLVAQGLEATFWRELFAWADAHAGPALFMHLTHLPLQGPLWDALRRVCCEDERDAALVKREERALLASDLSPEDYFAAALRSKKRKELRRQRRRLEEEGRLEVRRATGAEGLESWIGEFLALERGGWKGEEGSALASSPKTEALFREALHGAAARGKLERLGLRIDGQPVAMLASFLTAPGAYSFKTAFDERYSRYSPGVLLQRENLAMLERDAIEWTDSCAAADHPMIDHLWTERRAIGRVNIALGSVARRKLFGLLAQRETGRQAGALA